MELDPITGLYDHGARQRDPIYLNWLNPDPLTEKYPGVSPWSYCHANPVGWIDLNGEEPSPEEAARMDDYVYGNKPNSILIGGWEVSEKKINGVIFNDDNSGFKSQLFERTVNDVTEYCYVTAGTDFTSIEDWKNNISQLVGFSKQYSISMSNSEKISAALGSNELTFSGHSLGGGMAAANAYLTGRNAITFNAAWLSPLTIGYSKRKDANIDAYVNFFDELKIIQGNFGMFANGNKHISFNRSSVLGHSIDNFYEKGLWNKAKDYVSGKMNNIKGYLDNLWPNPSMIYR